MLLLAFRNLRARPARTLFTALAIALGVGMIFAMRIVGVTINQSAREAREGRLAGADLEVTNGSSANLNESLADDIAARPEVAAAAPIYRNLEGAIDPDASATGPLGAVTLRGTGLALLGVDPARTLTPYELAAGSFFSAPDASEVLLPSTWAAQNGVGVGSTVNLTTGDQTHAYTVVGLLKPGETPGQPTAWLPLKTLQTVFDAPGGATSVLVRLKSSLNAEQARDQLQADLGVLYVVSSAQAGSSARSSLAILSDFALPFAGLAILLSGSFLVYNAFAITLAERRREIGQLRTLGLTRGQVLALTLGEALLVALLASALGLLFGLLFGQGVTTLVSATRNETIQLAPVPWDGPVLAVGAGVLVTLAVTFNLAREASRVSPLLALGKGGSEARSHSWYERWGWLGAIGFLVVFGVAFVTLVNVLQTTTNLATASLLIYAVPFILAGVPMMALPAGVRGALRLFDRLAAQGGATSRLAAGSLARQHGRALLTAATVTIALMLVVALTGITLGASQMTQGVATSAFTSDFLLLRSPPGGLSLEQAMSGVSLPPMPPALKAELDGLQQRGEAEIVTMATFQLPGYSLGPGADFAFALNPDFLSDKPVYRAKEGSWDEAQRYFAAGPAIALPETAARRLRVHPGDTVSIQTLEGEVLFKVAVIDTMGTVVSPEVGEKYFHASPHFIFINTPPGQDKEALKAKVEAVARANGLFKVDPNQFWSNFYDTLFGSLLALFGGLSSLSGVVAGLSIVNTLVASVLERQREIGTLRALGMSRGQVRGLIVLEAGLLGLTGAVIGALGGLAISQAFGSLFFEGFGDIAPAGARWPLPWGIAGLALVLGPLIAMLAALYPADRAASVNPAEAMRAEGATGFLPPAKHLGPTGVRGLVARMPLAAKLSLTTGLVIVLTIAALTAVLVNYQRQLLEDNVRSLAARGTDFTITYLNEQISADIAELTPQTLLQLQQQAGAQASALQEQMSGDSAYEFGVKYVLITDIDHKVIFSDKPEYNGRVLTDTVTLAGSSSLVRLTEWTGERAFEAVAPVENKAGTRVGYIQMGFSTEPVDKIVRDTARNALWVMLAALAISIIITILFTRRALAPVAQIAEASYAVARGDLTRRVPQDRWDELGSLSRSFNDMVKGLNERDRIRDLFGRFVSREVQQEILAGRVTLKGERKTITCLYVDMRGSTMFAESRAPEEVMDALNQYFEVIVLSVEAHGGIVNRFVGDEAVCLFGAPTAVRDHAELAIQAALSMREGLAYLNHKRETLGLPTLKFGIGLNTGEVVAGATGTEERQEYTVIGDAMNLGARIQGLNKSFPDYDILLSEFTRAALGQNANDYKFADLGPVEIRGKSQPVGVLGLTGRTGK